MFFLRPTHSNPSRDLSRLMRRMDLGLLLVVAHHLLPLARLPLQHPPPQILVQIPLPPAQRCLLRSTKEQPSLLVGGLINSATSELAAILEAS